MTRRKLDAIDRLRADHMKVELLFIQIRAARDIKRREELFAKIAEELENHSRIEETIFYPACEKFDELKPMVLESYEEHRELKTLLTDMSEMSSRNPRFDAKLKVLADDFSHHVIQEENHFFPLVRERLSQTRLERMATELEHGRAKPRKKPSKAA